MNSRQLMMAALSGQAVERVPTGPLAVHYCARFAGVSLRQYSTDAQSLADSVIRYYERFQPDAVWLSADTWVSAQAMGARVDAQGDDQPLGGTGEALVRTPADIERIPDPDPSRQGRYPLMLEALARIRRAIGQDVCIVACFDQYPFSLASALMGLDAIMLRVVDDPAFVEALMERCAAYAIAYARALAEGGADILSGGDSPAGLLGPALYERIALPWERRVIGALRGSVARPVSLHICGNATPILPLMVESGADIFELDHMVDLGAALEIVGLDKAIWGNLDPVGLLARSAASQVRRAAREAIAIARWLSHGRFVLSSGCTLAVETPEQNVEALLSAGR